MAVVDSANPEVEASAISPVYVSFATILNLVERMEREGVPTQVDKSYLSNLAGGYQSQVLLALRTLGMIDEQYRVTKLLAELVSKPSERRHLVRTIVERQYPWAIDLGQAATHQQLVEAFRAHGVRLSANTRDKAVAFYLHAAAYGGVPLSPFFKGKRPGTAAVISAPSAPRARRRARSIRQREGAEELPAAVTSDSRSSRDERVDAYFRLLVSKAEKADGQGDNEILDRIERLLGVTQEGREST